MTVRYSLVGAVTLGFDLARLDRGADAAALLRTALRLDADDLRALAAVHPGSAERLRRRAAVPPREAPVGELARLEARLLGDADGLDALLRREVLDWTWVRAGLTAVQDPVAGDAADVVVDALLDAYLDAPAAVGLVTPFAASGVVPRRGHRTGLPAVDVVLDRLAGAGPADRTRWQIALDLDRPRIAAWSRAAHAATSALARSDRLRAALDAQLAAVVAFRAGGLGATDAARGLWNALAGCVQAHLAGDLLAPADAEALHRVWEGEHE